MGIKDVFERIKGKPDAKPGAADPAAEGRRKTDEETVQVGLRPTSPSQREQEEATRVVAPAPLERPMPRARPDTPTNPGVPAPRDGDTDPTVVATPGPAPQPVHPAASVPPRVPSPGPPPSTTPVAPRPGTPAAAAAAANTPVSSSDATVYATPEPEAQGEIAGVLVGLFGETRHQTFLVPDGESTLGRGEDCDIQIVDAKISRLHAALSCAGDAITIRPLNDRNPVLLNDDPIAGPVALGDGDKLQLGNTGASIFRFRTIDGL